MDKHSTAQAGEPLSVRMGEVSFLALNDIPDAGVHAARQSWLPLDARQLSAGRYRGSYRELDLPGIRAVKECQNRSVQKCGMMADNTCTVSWALGGDPTTRFSQFGGVPRTWLYLLPAATEFDAQVAAGSETLYLRFDQDELLAGARVLDEAAWESPPGDLMAIDSPGQRGLGALLDSLFQLLPGQLANGIAPEGDYIRRTIMDGVLLAMNSAVDRQAGDSPDYHARRRAFRIVSAAREYIDSSLETGRCPSVTDICLHVGVGGRSLQYGFRQVLRMTPFAYLRIVRLNRVRADLRDPVDPHTSVTTTATRWGFLNLGRFASDYKKMFGELPSDTLRYPAS